MSFYAGNERLFQRRIETMPHIFHLTAALLKRQLVVYVVIARKGSDTRLYVGKTGDNREGCNPMISRCGNHFSYNRIHSQVRNKLPDHESWDYTYVFEHFEVYCPDLTQRRAAISLVGFLAIGIMPGLGLLAFFQVFRRAMNYALRAKFACRLVRA
jgi:hypothetical protein